MADLVLYGYWRSSCSWRVRIALAHKGLDVRHEAVHLVRDGGAQHRAAHRERNAARQVPVLEVDGAPIAQSMAILEYLEERWPEPPLLPADPLDRARARQLAELINSGIQPLQNLAVLQHVEVEHGAEARKAWGAYWIARGLAALEAQAERTAGRYCVGGTVSFADLCLVPQLYNARRFGLALHAYPTLLRVEAACNELPAFMAAHPDVQPDAPQTQE